MTIDKIKGFLILNGWKEQPEENEFEEYFMFAHDYNYHIDVGKEDGEIVVLADQGDIFHIQLSHDSIYTLIGFLIVHPCEGRGKTYFYPFQQKENNSIK